MADDSEITTGSYAVRSINDSRDGLRAMSIQEFKDIFHIKADRWLRGETALFENARYKGIYTIKNETTGQPMKLHIWFVDLLGVKGIDAVVPCVLKLKVHCWDTERLGDPRKAFKDGRYSVTTDYVGTVTKITRHENG